MTKSEALQSAKPILFNTEMVRAIQNGTKTVTRRLIKPKYSNTNIEIIKNKYGRQLVEIQDENDVKDVILPDGKHCRQLRAMREITPKYRVGDILYVRETWFYEGHMHELTAGKPDLPSGRYSFRYVYKANYPDYPVDVGVGANGWCPSIHMPKEAARIFLRVTGVRVERLQDIDGYGVLSEGVDNGKSNPAMGNRWENMQRMAYSELWNSTLKKSDLEKYGWDANPWVWVIEFERLEVEI